MRLSNEELASLVAQTWPDGIIPQTGLGIRQTAYALGRAESGGRTDEIGDSGASYGIWQIYTRVHNYDPAWLVTADGNAQAAYIVSSGGANFNPWCTWEITACGGNGKGTYWQYLQEADEALAGMSQVQPIALPGGSILPSEDPGYQDGAPAGMSIMTPLLLGLGAVLALSFLIGGFSGGEKYLPKQAAFMPRMRGY